MSEFPPTASLFVAELSELSSAKPYAPRRIFSKRSKDNEIYPERLHLSNHIIYQSGDLVINLGTNLRTNSGGVFCGNNITVLKARKLRVWKDLNIWWNGISVKD